MDPKDRIIVALDVDSLGKATALAEELASQVGEFKFGLEFIHSVLNSLIVPQSAREASANLRTIRALFQLLDGKIFWDGKFDDIPNTVGGATKALGRMNVKMFNVHASAGRKSVEAAVAQKGNSLVLGVTVLTSLDVAECLSVFGDLPGPKVMQFAHMLAEVGANGIICSPQELELLGKHRSLDGLLRIIPGVRPAWATVGDQKRVMTPGEAIKAGATALVIGRPITTPPPEMGTPADAAKKIAEEIASVL